MKQKQEKQEMNAQPEAENRPEPEQKQLLPGESLPVIQNRWLQKIMAVLFVLLLLAFGGGAVYFNPVSVTTSGAKAMAAVAGGWEQKLTTWVAATESAFNACLPLKERWIDWYGFSERLAKKHFIRDVDYSYSVVKDNSDILQFITYTAEVPEIVQTLSGYEQYGVPIVYVQPPTKFMEGFTKFPINLNDQSKANTDNRLASLEQQGMPYLDLRQAADNQGLDKATMFYRTDHHWQTQTAFWAMQQTVAYVADTFGLELDPTGYYTNPDNYQQQTYTDCFLGSQGRRVGRYYNGLDDFTLITPNFDTSYQVDYIDEEEETKTGDFSQSILDHALLKLDSTPYTNRYATYFGGDHMKVVVNNQQMGGSGKRVLLVKDSFGLPYGAYLSTMVSQLTLIDLRYFPIAELGDYIAASDLDLIIVMYH